LRSARTDVRARFTWDRRSARRTSSRRLMRSLLPSVLVAAPSAQVRGAVCLNPSPRQQAGWTIVHADPDRALPPAARALRVQPAVRRRPRLVSSKTEGAVEKQVTPPRLVKRPLAGANPSPRVTLTVVGSPIPPLG
jgi:hypothetical protein